MRSNALSAVALRPARGRRHGAGRGPRGAERRPARPGIGVGCVFGNFVYGPAKMMYAFFGGFIGLVAYGLSAGDEDVAMQVIEPAWRGDYALTAGPPARQEGARVHRAPRRAPRGPRRRAAATATTRAAAEVEAGAAGSPSGTSGPARAGGGRHPSRALPPDGRTPMTDPLSLASLATAFAAGLLSVLSPCVMPLMPAYLSLISGISVEEMRAEGETRTARRAPRVRRRVLLGVRAASSRASRPCSCCSARPRPWSGACSRRGRSTSSASTITAVQVAGVVIVLMGLHLMGVLPIPWLYRDARFGQLADSRGASSAPTWSARPSPSAGRRASARSSAAS